MCTTSPGRRPVWGALGAAPAEGGRPARAGLPGQLREDERRERLKADCAGHLDSEQERKPSSEDTAQSVNREDTEVVRIPGNQLRLRQTAHRKERNMQT